MVKAKTFIVRKPFDGLPKDTDFELVEEELPPIQNGQFLAEAVFISVEPLMLGHPDLDTTLIGNQVAKVIDSKNPIFPVGKYVVGHFGCRTHTISDGKTPRKATVIPEVQDLPLSYFLGIFGTPGNVAYFGLLEICQPKAGETVVVSGAAGSVGCIVGQIAKIKGCIVIGITGSDEKGKWLVDDLKFDGFVNYKDGDFAKKLTEVTPEGVDCYFDNVGGDVSSVVLPRMNLFGRVSVCGFISTINDVAQTRPVQRSMVRKQLRMEGFVVTRWTDRWIESTKQNMKWVKDGKLQYRETVTEGFENVLKALVGMLQGGNMGKAVVKV